MAIRKLTFKKTNKKLNKRKLTKKKLKLRKRLNKKGGKPKRHPHEEKINIKVKFNNYIAAQEYLTRQYHNITHVGVSISKQQRNLYEWLNKFIEDDFESNKHLKKWEYQTRIEDLIVEKKEIEKGTNTKLFTKGWIPYPKDEEEETS